MIETAGEHGNSRPDKLAYSISEAAYVLGDVSPNHVRNLIRDKALDKVMVGRRVLVSAASVRRLIENGGTVSNVEAQATAA